RSVGRLEPARLLRGPRAARLRLARQEVPQGLDGVARDEAGEALHLAPARVPGREDRAAVALTPAARGERLLPAHREHAARLLEVLGLVTEDAAHPAAADRGDVEVDAERPEHALPLGLRRRLRRSLGALTEQPER